MMPKIIKMEVYVITAIVALARAVENTVIVPQSVSLPLQPAPPALHFLFHRFMGITENLLL
ncbi:MAG: hypothetical protein LUG59_02690 [Enterocloster clostridioformis]|nr:hypothetical protein [Enterocloster clostridioformis]